MTEERSHAPPPRRIVVDESETPAVPCRICGSPVRMHRATRHEILVSAPVCIYCQLRLPMQERKDK